MRGKPLNAIHVVTGSSTRTRGVIRAGAWTFPVALGRSGIRANKREGDGGTPRGIFHPVRIWWRADRLKRPHSHLPLRRIGPSDAWCEDPRDRRYNRPFKRSANEPGDVLSRHDHLYDLVVEIDHNTRPVVAGRGSAVFIHLARNGFTPTSGCVALSRRDLIRLVERLGRKTRIMIRD